MEDSSVPQSNTITLLDPRHKGFINGVPCRLHDQQVGMHVIISGFALVFGLLGILILLIGAVILETRAQLEQHGITIAATILDKTTSIVSTNKQGEQTLDYLLIYQFLAENKRYTAPQKISVESYNQLQKGDNIPVIYLPENPKISQIIGEQDNTTPNMIGMGIVFVLGAVIVFIWMSRRIWINRKLAREGQILESRIIETQVKRAYRGGSYLDIHYRFLNPAGQEIQKSVVSIRQDLFKNPPAYWTRAAVLYINDHHCHIL